MATDNKNTPRPRLSRAGVTPVLQVEVRDHLGRYCQVHIPGELPLTIRVDGQEIVTLMTLGTNPEELALGYLYNQRLLERIEDVESVEVDWDRETADVTTRHGRGIPDLDHKLSAMTISTSGGREARVSPAGDGQNKPPRVQVRQSTIYRVLQAVAAQNRVYRRAGSVHSFCLCQDDKAIMCVEDVGRHNAADAIAGRMWLDGVTGRDKILFTTGRLSSEMVMKTVLMGIPVLISKSGATQMGLELAREMGLVLVGRAKGTGFVVFNGGDRVVYDAVPDPGQAGT
jgi:FdhD protein